MKKDVAKLTMCRYCKSRDRVIYYRQLLLNYACNDCYIEKRKELADNLIKKGKTRKRSLVKIAKPKKYLNEYNAVCKQILRERDYVCGGCGASNKPLDFSHTVARSQAPEHICNINNIELMCRDCHNIWEHGSIEDKASLHNFTRMLNQLKYLAYPIYVKTMVKLGFEPKDIPNNPNI